MAERVQLRRTKGWRKPEGVINVARPTYWGNPFKVGETVTPAHRGWVVAPQFARWASGPGDGYEFVGWLDFTPETVAGCVEMYRAYLKTEVGRSGYSMDEEARQLLAGHDLACWCPLDQPCHADVLLDIANAESGRLDSGATRAPAGAHLGPGIPGTETA